MLVTRRLDPPISQPQKRSLRCIIGIQAFRTTPQPGLGPFYKILRRFNESSDRTFHRRGQRRIVPSTSVQTRYCVLTWVICGSSQSGGGGPGAGRKLCREPVLACLRYGEIIDSGVRSLGNHAVDVPTLLGSLPSCSPAIFGPCDRRYHLNSYCSD